MREGNSISDLVKIPDDWKWVKLGSVCDVRDGTHDSPKYHQFGVPFVTSKNLTDTKLDFTNIKYISEEDHRAFSKRSHVENGDILFGMIGTVGKPIIVNEDFEFSIKNVALIKFENNTEVVNGFAVNVLKSFIVENQFRRIANGGVLGFVALGSIRNLSFPLPPLVEQQKIAEILSTVDEKIEVIDAKIAQTQELKKGLMQRLLTKGIGHTEFKQSSIGEIPKSWRVLRLGEIGEFKNGINKSKEDFGHGFPFINLMNVFGTNTVKSNGLSLVNATQIELEDYNLLKGDVLFIRSSVKPEGVGLTAVVNTDLPNTVFSGFLIRFRENDNNLLTDFKKHCFFSNDFRKRLLNLSSVSANTNINQKSLESLPIPIPPTEEQLQIAQILDACDEKIILLEEKRDKFLNLKGGLMQQLLTGKIRVNSLINKEVLA